ncbi:MAG: hypothetical protein Q4D38_05885 [Planctomycetia bacterium]|nr:hypothetical protein [Planctomycetia bacterium]
MYDKLQLRGLVEKDPRYKLNAYYYVLETLDFAHSRLGMGSVPSRLAVSKIEEDVDEPEYSIMHISGAELCQAILLRARWMFGYMAKVVFNEWGAFTTDDFGEIVFNMVEAGKIRLAKGEGKDDFHNVYDFQTVFCDDFHFPQNAS